MSAEKRQDLGTTPGEIPWEQQPEVKDNMVRLNPMAVGATPKSRKMLSVLS